MGRSASSSFDGAAEMTMRGSYRRFLLNLVAFSFLFLFGFSNSAFSQQQKQAQSAPGESEYAGAAACKTCHEDIYNGWEKSPHWKTTLDTKGGPSKQGCEACHGAAAAHVADPGDTSKVFKFENASAK
jgi:hypothetical protein